MGDGPPLVCAYGSRLSLSQRSRHMDGLAVHCVFHIADGFMVSRGSLHGRVGEAATMFPTSGEHTPG